MLSRKYQARIQISKFDPAFEVKIKFGRPMDSEVKADLLKLQENEGIRVYLDGQPLITMNGTYIPEEVGYEVEKILRSNGLTELSIVILEPGKQSELTTLLEY